MFFIGSIKIISANSNWYRYRYQFVGEVMMDIFGANKIIHPVRLRIPKGTKNIISISIAVLVECLIRNENIAFEEHKIENCLKLSYI